MAARAFAPLLSRVQELNNSVISNPSAYNEQHLMRPPGFPATGKEASGAAQNTDQLPFAEMSELDKFGLAGLLRMIHSDNADVSSLAVGQDLMTLGLDLNQPEYVLSHVSRAHQAMLTHVLDLYIRRSPPHLLRPCRVFLWSRTSLFRHATALPMFSLFSRGFRASAMRHCSTYSTACLGIYCRKSLRKN